jgi:dTDP-4-amino-4,6-dideoxygalactose transaminase
VLHRRPGRRAIREHLCALLWCRPFRRCGNGTDALELELGLRAAGVGAGDEVITVANAGGYTTAACQAIGARPVYIDVDPLTCQLNTALIDEAITGVTRALVVNAPLRIITSLPCFAELTADKLNQVLDALHTIS